MTPNPKPPRWRWPARLSIWSIRHHDLLVAHLRFYVWSVTATVLLLSMGNIISLTTALYAILFSVLGLIILIWLLLERRRTTLLSIEDANLRQEAEAAMHAFIHARRKRIRGKRQDDGYDSVPRGHRGSSTGRRGIF